MSDEIAFPNQTCADIELAYATTNAKCQRAEANFNAVFDACCRPSIPLYQCEAHVHESLFGDDSDYNCLIPPVVGLDPEERLKVKFHITYQAIESIEETEGACANENDCDCNTCAPGRECIARIDTHTQSLALQELRNCTSAFVSSGRIRG